MVQLVELPAVVDLCYDGVKILLYSGVEVEGSISAKVIFFLQSYLNTMFNDTRSK